MFFKLTTILWPKDARTLRVLLLARVSCPGEGKQDIRSLDDQEAMLRKFAVGNYGGSIDFTVIAGTGSGENLGRADYERLRELIRTGRYDVVIVEDLARIARRLQVHSVCELCVDHGTRLIALNDNLDTAVPGWEDRSIFASWHHERANRDTSDRIKRTLKNRFSNGGALALPIYGYIKPPGARDDGDLIKDTDAGPIYKEWFRRLDEDGASFASIADWLNAKGVRPGPYARRKKWDSRMVGRVTRNSILKGERYHGERESVRINDPGVYRMRKAPAEALQTRIVPDLAFFPAEYYDRVIANIERRNSKYQRKDKDGRDPLLQKPKKRTRYPGQCIFCGVCGQMYVFGGHGQTEHLMCDGARSHKCWNGATVDGPLAAEKISAAVMAQIEGLEGFDQAYLATLNDEALLVNTALNERLAALDKLIVTTEAETANIVKFIREGRASAPLAEELTRLEAQLNTYTHEKAQEESRKVREIRLPPMEELKERGRAKFRDLALDSYQFAEDLRRLTPRIIVFPHRLIGGGQIVLRAQFRLQLAELIPDRGTRTVVQPALERVMTVDLFESPQREIFRAAVVEGRRVGEREQDVARRLGITHTAAQRAMALQRQMDEMGVQDAYQPVIEPPEDGRIKRHKHARYQFDPLPDAGQV